MADGSRGDIPIFLAHTDYTKPEGQTYAEFKFLSSLTKIGFDELRFRESLNSFVLRGQREFTITLTVFGDDALDCASLVQCAEDTPEAYQLLNANNLAIREINTFNDVSQFLESDHQIRMVMDIRFGLGLEKIISTPTIDKVSFKNKTIDPAVEFEVDLTEITGG